jgi:hypothetical protein
MKLHDKRDDFYFPIENFPFMRSTIPAAPAYEVYLSQTIRYSRSLWLLSGLPVEVSPHLYLDIIVVPCLLTNDTYRHRYATSDL